MDLIVTVFTTEILRLRLFKYNVMHNTFNQIHVLNDG